MPNNIHFFTEELDFNLPQKIKTREWLQSILKKEDKRVKEINFIFCSDEYLLKINQEYLNHDTYTDIITFDNSEDDRIMSDIFISIERVTENAKLLKIVFIEELHRVMAHGVLHLLGYKDKNKADKQKMTEMENQSLANRKFNNDIK